MTWPAAVLAAIAVIATAGADSVATHLGAAPAAHVIVTPDDAAVFAGTVLRLHADVVGGSEAGEPITWSVFGSGTIDADGTFHAPVSRGGDVTIVAAARAAAGATRLAIVAPPPLNTPLSMVACYGDGALDVRGVAGTLAYGRFAAGEELGSIAVAPDGSMATVTDGSQLDDIDLRAMAVQPSAIVSGARFSEAAALRDGLVAATNANAGVQDDGLYIFQTKQGAAPALVATAAAGDTPEGIAVAPDGQTIYVTSVNSDSLMRFAVDAGGTLRRTGLATTGTRPFGVALAPRHRLLLVADNDTPTLSGRASRPGLEFFALPSMRRIGNPIATGSVNALPLGIAVDEVEGRAFVTNEGDDDVAVYSLTTFRRQATLRVGRTPWLPAVDARRHLLYVPDARDNTVDVFDTRTLAHVGAAFETCAYPTAVGIAG